MPNPETEAEAETRALPSRIAAGLPALERYVRRRMGAGLLRHESVSDVVQSTVRELLRSGRFENRGEAGFQGWLRMAAEHKLKKRARYWRAYGRGAQREPLASMDTVVDARREAPPSPSRDAVAEEDRARVQRAIQALPDDSAFVVRRVQLDGASYAEVANEMERSPEAVRKLLARALARLSTILRES